jgi:hypothetical protein
MFDFDASGFTFFWTFETSWEYHCHPELSSESPVQIWSSQSMMSIARLSYSPLVRFPFGLFSFYPLGRYCKV